MADEKRALLDKPSVSTYTDLSNSLSDEREAKDVTLLNRWMSSAAYPWKWIVKKTFMRECLAEFFGTFMLVVIGNCAVAQAVLSNPPDKFGTFRSINIGYALGLMVGVFVSIGVSGGHVNPAVTLAMALRGRIKWIMVVPYWIAQLLGAFFSSPFVHGVYADAINAAGGIRNINVTAGVFSSFPSPYLTLGNGFFDQLFGTFVLITGVFAILDSKNSEVQSGLKPVAVGFVLWAVGSSFGMNSGYSLNPARDLGPRLYIAMVGWGPQVFTCDFCGNIRHWWWVPIVAPMIGGALAAFFYWFFIDAHHPEDEEEALKSSSRIDVNCTQLLGEVETH